MAPMLDNALIKRLASDPTSQPLKSAAVSPAAEKPWATSGHCPSAASTSPPPHSMAATSPPAVASSPSARSPSAQAAQHGKTSPLPLSARSGRPMSRQSPRPTSRQADTRLNDVSERPQKPDKVMKMQAVAQSRSDCLQNIFTSRHSERCDRLRNRLGSLTSQANELRTRIATLEQELQEATTERLNLDTHRGGEDSSAPAGSKESKKFSAGSAVIEEAKAREKFEFMRSNDESTPGGLDSLHEEVGEAKSTSEGLDTSHEKEEGGGLPLAPALTEQDLHSAAGTSVSPVPSLNVFDEPASAAASVRPSRDMSMQPQKSEMVMPPLKSEMVGAVDKTAWPQSVDKRYQDEVLMPLLVRRRAEARFKEASYIHEQSVNQMKAELLAIERRTVKQQVWMKQVDAQVLKVELNKARYQVRLDSARKRVETLGKHLSQAYENMEELLQDRFEVEDLAVKNDALLWYLHLLGVSDADNASNFIDNKTELQFLNERSQRLFKKRRQLDDLLESVRCTQLLAADIVKHSEELAGLSEQLHQLWNLVPVEWKESVMKSVQKGIAAPLSMHPVNAIQALQGASSHVSNSMKSYLRALSEYIDGTHTLANRRRAFKGGMESKHLGELSLQYNYLQKTESRDKEKLSGRGMSSSITKHLSDGAKAQYNANRMMD